MGKGKRKAVNQDDVEMDDPENEGGAGGSDGEHERLAFRGVQETKKSTTMTTVRT